MGEPSRPSRLPPALANPFAVPTPGSQPPADQSTGPEVFANAGVANDTGRALPAPMSTPTPEERYRAAVYLANRLPVMVVWEGGAPRQLTGGQKVERVLRELPDSMVAGWVEHHHHTPGAAR